MSGFRDIGGKASSAARAGKELAVHRSGGPSAPGIPDSWNRTAVTKGGERHERREKETDRSDAALIRLTPRRGAGWRAEGGGAATVVSSSKRGHMWCSFVKAGRAILAR